VVGCSEHLTDHKLLKKGCTAWSLLFLLRNLHTNSEHSSGHSMMLCCRVWYLRSWPFGVAVKCTVYSEGLRFDSRPGDEMYWQGFHGFSRPLRFVIRRHSAIHVKT
jgi:hypothetical protein